MMATAVQKNSLEGLSNGNGLVHPPLNGYGGDVEEVSAPEAAAGDSAVEEPEIDIMINNVVCSFSVRCHLNLREIALNGINVEYRKENGKITMKLRRPYTTASIWSSGKVTCTGATSELQAKIAARRFARCLQKLGFKVRFNNYRVVNVLGTCSMPFAIKINSFSERHKEADYEPELHPGVTYKLQSPKATLKIFSTGSVTVTAPSVADVQAAIEYIFPLVYEFRKERTPEEAALLALKKSRQMTRSPAYDEEEEYQEEESDWD
ncbi:TATA box-binding protein-like 1 [Tribolium castaneum]|uniref:TATA box-binding protein-like 1 n=1 Tax=Tribolium castaneum TaxID=7070 RepID=D6WNH0_TRICA|nr:PREDICTED: TATA box-binding protein-like protein 1 [Tribolium castaneum]XP_015835948.1 PREDICTED: TATA box-binding protein-like protein 1 [Tribolium castaneum]EFA04368.2 TATA-box-binding protein-like Protein [Tribolium castaneum]|eukprot:XP_015835947.1 PREDICTED: TATA box-binding protein-like protein 1 [Tribolium castaneum]